MVRRLFVFKLWILLTVLLSSFSLASVAQAGGAGKKLGLFPEERISSDELRQKQLNAEKLVVFDARDPLSFEIMHMEGAILPRSSDYYEKQRLFREHVTSTPPDADKALIENMKQYPKNTAIVTYCNSDGCQASAVMVKQLQRMGFTNAKALEDGIQVWQEKGYPVSSASHCPTCA